MIKPKYNLGEEVWWAETRGVDRSITCPDCLGSGQLTVTFADGEQVSIECGLCARGFQPATGRVSYFEFTEQVRRDTIAGVELGKNEVLYKMASGYSLIEEEVFSTEPEAQARAVILAETRTAEALQKAQRKHKDTRSWAWNASYHRRELKEAKRRVDFHTAQLNMCNLKAKNNKEQAE